MQAQSFPTVLEVELVQRSSQRILEHSCRRRRCSRTECGQSRRVARQLPLAWCLSRTGGSTCRSRNRSSAVVSHWDQTKFPRSATHPGLASGGGCARTQILSTARRKLAWALTPELSRAAKRRRLERTVRPRAHELPRARQTRWRSDRGTAEGGSKLLPPSGSRTLSRGWIETGSACSASPSRDKRTQGR
jgi:hypothetical protein